MCARYARASQVAANIGQLLGENGESGVVLETLDHLLELGLGHLLVPVPPRLEDLLPEQYSQVKKGAERG